MTETRTNAYNGTVYRENEGDTDMCSICGIYAQGGVGIGGFATVREMSRAMAHRGPDGEGGFSGGNVGLHHNRLAVVDVTGGAQPMTVVREGKRYIIVYNGELYNTDELRAALAKEGVRCRTHSDTEALVYAYAVWGEDCLERLNGIFAFSIYDDFNRCLFCARDRLGVKPFFYCETEGKFLFASEVKALLRSPSVKPVLDAVGLWQLLYLAPVTLPGSGVFRDIRELLPGECCRVDADGAHRRKYWTLAVRPHTDSDDETVAYVRHLFVDAVRRQLVSDVPLCTFLSGGLDSSAVSAVAAEKYREEGRVLSTYSFEYEGNTYAPTLFQPNPDDAYARLMAEHLGTDHTVLTASSDETADALLPALLARDFPGQADIDSSLYYFCGRVRERHTVALSGECADEIFGGYPWFYRPEMLARDFFPWIHDPSARIGLFDPRVTRAEEGYAYLSEVYRNAVAATPLDGSESEEDRTARIATKLSVDYFMANLLERKDRMSMAHGLEVRVPFSDHRILEYVYQVPWRIKYAGGVEKALLRNAMTGYLPPEILYRKKSPYPKTHNPAYENRVRGMLFERLRRKNSRLASLLRPGAVDALAAGEDLTWLGQLMSRPQLYAWLYQFDCFLEKYEVTLAI